MSADRKARASGAGGSLPDQIKTASLNQQQHQRGSTQKPMSRNVTAGPGL
eukprot:CAMPEP_0113728798 /NCGR_PEP_ID=MMETSP0038_2-20120614/42130_1 /TAXON_ID=2898 /ORGANISM="Cryptomonas paramecium" /LENGTH=49 /DNA_ID=CAMNT_0000660441 /DNA_START=34 /DNA_END=179 /DNA_ORIENTATION=- /assembly_acc=CAM_ASM_000170